MISRNPRESILGPNLSFLYLFKLFVLTSKKKKKKKKKKLFIRNYAVGNAMHKVKKILSIQQ